MTPRRPRRRTTPRSRTTPATWPTNSNRWGRPSSSSASSSHPGRRTAPGLPRRAEPAARRCRAVRLSTRSKRPSLPRSAPASPTPSSRSSHALGDRVAWARSTARCSATAGRWRSRSSGPASANDRRRHDGHRGTGRVPDSHTEVGRIYGFRGMVDEFHRSIMAELDYRLEAANLRLLGRTWPAIPASSCPSRSTTTPRRPCSPWTWSTGATWAPSGRWLAWRATAAPWPRTSSTPTSTRSSCTASSMPTPIPGTCCSPPTGGWP